MELDAAFRIAVFDWLTQLTALRSDYVVTWKELSSFRFRGERATLIGAEGIWKPRQLELPISVATAPPKPGRSAPYDDEVGDGGTLRYMYRGTDPQHPSNVGMRRLCELRKPLVYFYGIEAGRYVAFFPTYITADEPAQLSVTLQVDDASTVEFGMPAVSEGVQARREYVTVAAKRRLHQAGFRARVMRAYRQRCAVCNLAHESLLDAAHIVPDRDPRGVAAVKNGLSLCKIHHAAYDTNILGIDPDHVIHVRGDILDEIDGPMLQHGIKENHGQRLLVVPSRTEQRPSGELLDLRFAEFRRAN